MPSVNERSHRRGCPSDVATNTSGGGSGLFSVLLTHYRVSLFGQCLTYAASVTGTATFNY